MIGEHIVNVRIELSTELYLNIGVSINIDRYIEEKKWFYEINDYISMKMEYPNSLTDVPGPISGILFDSFFDKIESEVEKKFNKILRGKHD